MSALRQDIRYALRVLFRDRSFTATAVLTLAVCIAANTAIFSVVRSVLFKPLPVPDSQSLALLYNSYPNAGAPRAATGVPDYFDRIRDVPALSEHALLRSESLTYGAIGGAQQVRAFRVTPSFFTLVRLQPAEGRIFREDEGEPGQDAQAILAFGFWQREFGGDPGVVGRTIRIDDTPRTVVGVAPADFLFLRNDVDLFIPASFTAEDKGLNRRHSNSWQMIGRVATGSSLNDVQQQIDALNAANDERFPEFRQILKDAGFRTHVVNLQDDLVRDVSAVLYLLWGGGLFVLLIGCVNIANLVTVRSGARAREMATRHAIGADLGRLVRQLVTETMLLAGVGGVLGMLLGWWSLRWVSALNLEQLPRGYEVQLDVPSLVVILALTLVVGVALGLAAAVRLWRMNVNQELREEGRGGTTSRRARFVRRGLATAQVAIAFILLIGAGLMLASFRAVLDLDLGFDPDQVYTAQVSLPEARYPDDESRVAFLERALEAVQALPDVETAGATTGLPFSSDHNDSVVLAEGYEMKPGESLISPMTAQVSPGYFEGMRVELVSGRLFAPSDMAAGATPTVIIDERLARKWWPDRDAVGRRLYFPTDMKDITAVTSDTVFMNVVGVVRDVRISDPSAENIPVGTYYLPFGRSDRGSSDSMTFIMRARTESTAIMSNVKQAIAGIDPSLPLFRVGTMHEWIDDALVGRRVPMYLAMAFGAVGLFLSAIGIYGVLAYGVAERRRELGVRIALGGSARRVFGLVLSDGLKIIGVGLTLGAAGAFFTGRFLESQLFGVSPTEPVVLATVAAALAVVALAASLIPSWRATRIDPIDVLGR